jgi:hypothetical protein
MNYKKFAYQKFVVHKKIACNLAFLHLTIKIDFIVGIQWFL